MSNLKIENPWDDADKVELAYSLAMNHLGFMYWLNEYDNGWDMMFKRNVVSLFAAFTQGWSNGYDSRGL